jgi:hypothetical protein
MLFFFTSKQITTGAPTMDVMAFMGKVKSIPGIWDTVSQANMIIAPINSVAQKRVL